MPQHEQTLFRTDQALKKRGLPGMPADTLREVAKWIEHPEAQQQLASGEMTPDMIAEEVSQALTGMGVAVSSNAPQIGMSSAMPSTPSLLRTRLRQRMSGSPSMGGSPM